MNKYVTVKEMAAILRVSGNTIRRRATARDIPSIKIGSSFRFEPEKVIRVLESRQKFTEPKENTI